MDYVRTIRRVARILPRSMKDELQSRLGVSQRGAIHTLKKWGLDPDLVIDAGAYHGLWTREMADFFPRARWLLIEPQEQFRPIIEENLRGTGIDYQVDHRLIYRADGEELDFFVVRHGDCKTGSSIYREKDRELDTVRKRTVTLDSLARERGLAFERVFLKMDVQGAELDGLAGAAAVLGKTQAILLESNLLDYNQGSPVLHDIDQALHEAGFQLADLAGLHRLDDGRLSQLDAIYLPATSPYFSI